MKLPVKLSIALVTYFIVAQGAGATEQLNTDYSGIYDCTGIDSHEGPYKGKVTIEAVPSQNKGEYSAYLFQLDAEGYGTYKGHAAAKGNQMAIYFALTDPTHKDYGTGIATFKKNSAKKWTFEKYYFEPEFKGGNHGVENCVQR